MFLFCFSFPIYKRFTCATCLISNIFKKECTRNAVFNLIQVVSVLTLGFLYYKRLPEYIAMLPSAVDQIKSGVKSPHTNQSILWKLILLLPEESLALCRWKQHFIPNAEQARSVTIIYSMYCGDSAGSSMI